MRLGSLARLPILLLVLVFVPAALAANEDILPCDGACSVFMPPVAINMPSPPYAAKYVYGDYVEGIVRFQFTVGIGGHVSDITVVQLLGPQKFADNAKNTMRDWLYKPAISNGQPVVSTNEVQFVFKIANIGPSAKPAVSSAYNDALALIKAGKLDEALAKLTQMRSKPELTLYERGSMANLMAIIQNEKKNYQEVRRLLDLLGYYSADVLPVAVMRSIWHLRVIADLHIGDMADAAGSLTVLERTSGFDPKDPLLPLVADARRKIGAVPAFDTDGKIPDVNAADGFAFQLYRRNFSIHNISGQLQKLKVSCDQGVTESPVSEKAEWHVPKNFSHCHLFIYGAPGTTFEVAQLADAPTPTLINH